MILNEFSEFKIPNQEQIKGGVKRKLNIVDSIAVELIPIGQPVDLSLNIYFQEQVLNPLSK